MAYTSPRVGLLETPVFTRQITALLRDEEYRRFQSQLAANPAIGSVIKGGGGIRKVRSAVGSRGKRGGARVIYYWAVSKDLILLLYAYPEECYSEYDTQTDRPASQACEGGVRNEI